MAKQPRFVELFREGNELTELKKVIMDVETGVNYLVWKSGNAAGITPLLDSDGKPLVIK